MKPQCFLTQLSAMNQDINWHINCTDVHSVLSDLSFQGLTESFVSKMATMKTKNTQNQLELQISVHLFLKKCSSISNGYSNRS